MIPIQPEIRIIEPKMLVGRHISMSLSENKTMQLWQTFMPERNKIRNRSSEALFSLSIYDPSLDFRNFTLQTVFEKWAAIEVTRPEEIPDGMLSLALEGGFYAVFLYKGKASEAGGFFRNIYTGWLPGSGYRLDNTRPHFEILGAKYKHEDPDSEEEVWIPIRE